MPDVSQVKNELGMQKKQSYPFGATSNAGGLESRCSCPKCESSSCLIKKLAKDLCSCSSRGNSRFSLIHNSIPTIKLATGSRESKTRAIITKQISDINFGPSKHCSNVVEEQEFNNKKEIISDVDEPKPKPIKESTTTIFKLSNASFCPGQVNDEKLSKVHNVDIEDSRKKSKNEKGSIVYGYRKRAFSEGIKNVKPSYIAKDVACHVISDEVINMQCQELEKPISKANVSSGVIKLSAVDVYKKIKEAYKACSCKVCECIAGKSLQNELCRCKPCECNDCANLSNCKLSLFSSELIQKNKEECFCLLCDKKSCKVVDIQRTFNFEENRGRRGHSELHNLKSSRERTQNCECKPCECIECKVQPRHRTLIVAPVGEELQQNHGCRCAPCECVECRHLYGVTNNGHNEISTGVDRHPQCHCEMCDNEACIPDNNQSCRCVRQSKVMSKPFERDSHDYDIRTAQVTYNNRGMYKGNFETLAMFAALPSTYTKRENRIKRCECDGCECLYCKYRDSTNLLTVSSQMYQFNQEVNGSSKCREPNFSEQFNYESRSHFNVSDSMTCDGFGNSAVGYKTSAKKSTSKFSARSICKCNICDCVVCNNMITTCAGDICQCAKCKSCQVATDRGVGPVKKKDQIKYKDPFTRACVESLETNEKVFQQSISSIGATKSSESIDNFGELNHPVCCQVCYGNHQMLSSDFEADAITQEQISKSANDLNFSRHNKAKMLLSSLSIFSSTSYVKDNDSISPAGRELKSLESSCNSSGYDYPDYLAHFPKLDSETYSDDPTQCDAGNVTSFSGVPSNNVAIVQSSQFNTMQDQKTFQPQHTTVRCKRNGNTKVNLRGQQTEGDLRNCVSQHKIISTDELNSQNPYTTYKVYPDNDYNKLKTDSTFEINSINSTISVYDEEFINGVQKTLKEAREFSQYLVSLYEKYEQANREFKSVSEQIRKTNYSINHTIHILRSVTQANKSNETFTVHEVPTKDSDTSTFTSAMDEMDTANMLENGINDTHNFQSSFTETAPIQNFNILSNDKLVAKDGFSHQESQALDYALIENNAILNTINEEKDLIDVVHKQKKSSVKKNNKRYNQITKRSQYFVKRKRSLPVKSFDVFDDAPTHDNETQGNIHCQETQQTEANNTDVDSHVKSNIPEVEFPVKLSKEKLFIPTEERSSIGVNIKGDFEDQTLPKVTENTNLLNFVTESNTELFKRSAAKDNESISINTLQTQNIVMITEQNDEIVEEKTEISEPLLSNNDKNSDIIKPKNTVMLPTPCERHVKAATEIISRQPLDEHATYIVKNNALEKVQSEVKRILELPILRQMSEHKKQQKHDKNCEAMKVTALIARRISDHSVLIKWKLPVLLNNVKGYDILVDGRPVQKSLCMSRCMAVVTCLPHAEKVLLTVRTIVTFPITDTCHYPTATLVHHTRKRSQSDIIR